MVPFHCCNWTPCRSHAQRQGWIERFLHSLRARPILKEAFVAPAPLVEGTTQIFEVLEIKQVGIHDNFFELGTSFTNSSTAFCGAQTSLQVELSGLSLRHPL